VISSGGSGALDWKLSREMPAALGDTAAVVTQPEVQPDPPLTGSATVTEVEGLKSAVPVYAAVSSSVPEWAKQAVSVAVPPLRLAVPKLEPPAEKVTAPTGVAQGEVTVAVRVTCSRVAAVVGETVSVVAVDAASIVSVTAPLTEAEKLPSPG
jgi:hypothetical protein